MTALANVICLGWASGKREIKKGHYDQCVMYIWDGLSACSEGIGYRREWKMAATTVLSFNLKDKGLAATFNWMI